MNGYTLAMSMVFIAIPIVILLGWIATKLLSAYFIHHRPYRRLEVLVKDANTYVEGHKFCQQCSQPLRIYARSMGFSSNDGEESWAKIGRCESWKWYHVGWGRHCRMAEFSASSEGRSYTSILDNEYLT